VDAHVGDPGEFADGHAEIDFPASVPGGREQVEDRRPQDQPGHDREWFGHGGGVGSLSDVKRAVGVVGMGVDHTERILGGSQLRWRSRRS
jgi:hypothetical protein